VGKADKIMGGNAVVVVRKNRHLSCCFVNRFRWVTDQIYFLLVQIKTRFY